ncbi:MAG TPA: hypothetical protein VJ206_07545 [bacterium]|nr:hypothetical protein [bacterium]
MARSIEIKITGDASSLKRAFGQAEGAAGSFGSKVGNVAGKGLKLLGVAALAAGAAAGAGLAATLKIGISSLIAHEKADAQTAAALKSTGQAAKVSMKEIQGHANAIEKLTGIDDVNVQAGQNMLLTFTRVRNEVGKGNDIFSQATDIMADMSVALGKDMPSSALMLGKALNDPIKGMTALGRAGVQFTDAQKDAIKAMVESGDVMGAQKLILAELTKEFGGSAAALGDTFAGKVNILKARFEELAEGLASKVMPYAERFVGFLEDVIQSDSAGEAIGKLGSGLKSVFEGIGDFIAGVDWGKVASTLGTALGGVLSTIGKFLGDVDWSGVMKAIGGGLSKAASAVTGWLADVNWGKVFGTALGAISAFIGSVDWGKILGDLGEFVVKLVAGLAGAVAKADWGTIGGAVLKGLRGALDGIAGELVKIGEPWGAALGEVIWDMAKDVGQAAAKVLDAFAAIVAGFGDMAGWLKGIPGIGEQFEGMDKAAQGAAKRIEEIASNMRDLKSPADKAADEVERLRDRFEELRGEAGGLKSPFDRAKDSLSAFAGQIDVADAAVLILTESLHRMPTKAEIKAFLKDAEAKAAIEALVAKINGMPGKKDIKADFLSKEAARLADELNAKVKAIPDKSSTTVTTPGAVESRNKLDDVAGSARGIPGSRNTHVSTLGVSTAVGALYGMRNAVYSIPTSWSTTVTTFFRTVGSAFSFAHGGVSPGGMALVGEQGPELVNLPRGARVFSNPQSRRMMSGGQNGGMGGGVTVNVVVHGSVMSERDLAHTIRDTLLQGAGSVNPSLWGARA